MNYYVVLYAPMAFATSSITFTVQIIYDRQNKEAVRDADLYHTYRTKVDRQVSLRYLQPLRQYPVCHGQTRSVDCGVPWQRRRALRNARSCQAGH